MQFHIKYLIYQFWSKIDVVFVMDKSGSIGTSNFNLEKQFVANLIEYFPIFPARTRMAIVTYSTSVKLEFNFNKNLNKECLRKALPKVRSVFGLLSYVNFIYKIATFFKRVIFCSKEKEMDHSPIRQTFELGKLITNH